jgi:hypothetical protein
MLKPASAIAYMRSTPSPPHRACPQDRARIAYSDVMESISGPLDLLVKSSTTPSGGNVHLLGLYNLRRSHHGYRMAGQTPALALAEASTSQSYCPST